jgi:hypothetical protein
MLVVPLPPPAELEKLLSGLLMRTVKVAKAPGEAPGAPCAVALYRTEDPVLELAVLCDVPLAASLAAALSVVPAGAVKDCVAAGSLDESLRDNFAEVMNVLARFVSTGSGRRFTLQRVSCPPEPPVDALLTAAAGSDEKRELSADVSGYSAGRIAFCTL